MSNLKTVIAEIDRLQSEVNTYRPLNPEQEARFFQKVRMEWNYNSCNIEGNILTYGETKDLLMWGITAKGKPLKDHLEINGHNEALEWIFEIIKEKSRPLNETFIRELHQMIMPPSPLYSDAITPDGKPSKKEIKIGQYKTSPNHVKTHTGEIFYFASPEETPAKMYDLVDWLLKANDKKEAHPLILACLFHYRFVRIHPFDDGNGRLARILMNFILMMYGFPPTIIPTKRREAYIKSLELADDNNTDAFILFVGECLIDTLSLLLKAAKGKSIEEDQDLDKKIALLDRQLTGYKEKEGEFTFMDARIQDIYSQKEMKKILEPLLTKMLETLGKFDKYFSEVTFENRRTIGSTFWSKENKNFQKKILNNIFGKGDSYIELGNLYYRYSIFEKFGLVEYSKEIKIEMCFPIDNELSDSPFIEMSYISIIADNTLFKREDVINRPLTTDEINDTCSKVANYMYGEIEKLIRQEQEKIKTKKK